MGLALGIPQARTNWDVFGLEQEWREAGTLIMGQESHLKHVKGRHAEEGQNRLHIIFQGQAGRDGAGIKNTGS